MARPHDALCTACHAKVGARDNRRMDRRLLLTALACWPAAGLRAQDGTARPRHKISAGQLYEALSARFPLRVGIPGVLDLQVSAPQLLLLPTRNKLGAALAAEVGGLQLQQAPAGQVDILFSLRYEASDQTLRGHDPEIREVRWPGLPPETVQALQSMLPALAGRLGEMVLHRFSPRELALADTMGFEPEEFQVVDDGLVILFGPKPRR
jgi:hypothetical protein